MSRLWKKYHEEIIPKLMKELGLKNIMCIPRLEKIVLNRGVGIALENKKILDESMDELALISGQKPIKTKARKSIANFKIREGYYIGCKVTLRGKRMYDFLDKLMNIALPRIRDFKGLSDKSFDGRGNYSIGIKEQVVFPEIDYNKISRITGLDVTLNTHAANDAQAKLLLSSFGMPFAKKSKI